MQESESETDRQTDCMKYAGVKKVIVIWISPWCQCIIHTHATHTHTHMQTTCAHTHTHTSASGFSLRRKYLLIYFNIEAYLEYSINILWLTAWRKSASGWNLFICTSVHPSNYPPIYSSIQAPTHPIIHPYNHSSIKPSAHPSRLHTPTDLTSTPQSIHPSIHPNSYSSIHLLPHLILHLVTDLQSGDECILE